MLACAWNFVFLFLVHISLLDLNFWRYHVQGGLFLGIPFDLYLGWVILWGAVPLLCFPRLPIPMIVGIMALFDLVFMPLCAPVVELREPWLIGECYVLVYCLLPGLYLARFTEEDRQLGLRAFFQAITFAGMVFVLIPAIIEANTTEQAARHLAVLLINPQAWEPVSWHIQWICIVSVMGMSATQEFVLRGNGTPVPFDPPKKLVISGMYAYIANPMQISCILILVIMSLMLKSNWMFAVAVVSFIYCVGIAWWDEGEDLRIKFGDDWLRYRNEVHYWVPRWRPYVAQGKPQAVIYIAQTCQQCQQVQLWLEKRAAKGLVIVAAEDHPSKTLTRITYDPLDGSFEDVGVAAIARALEHFNFAWAYLGVFLRLPGVKDIVQLIVDACGGGPKSIPRNNSAVCPLS